MLFVLAQLPSSAFWEKALDQVPALTVFGVVGLAITILFLRTIRNMANTYAAQQETTGARMVDVIDRNTEAFAGVEVLTYEVRELRREANEWHKAHEKATRDHAHDVRDLANAAGLRHEWERLQRQQVHTMAGGPPGSIVVETPPVAPPLGPGDKVGGQGS